MAITDQAIKVEYVHASGVVDYNIPFITYDTAPPYGDISVYSVDSSDVYTILSESTDYTFQTIAGGRELPTGIKLPDTLRLNSDAVMPIGDTLKIVRDTELTQNNIFADKTIEFSLDKLTAKVQELGINVGSSDGLQVAIDANTADIATDAARITATEAKDGLQDTAIALNITNIAALDAGKTDTTVTDGLDAAITVNEGDITANATMSSNAMAKANNNETDIAALALDAAQVVVNKDDITLLYAEVASLEADAVVQDASIVDHEGRVQVLEDNLLDAVINGTMDIVNNVTVPAVVTYEDPQYAPARLPLTFDADETASVEIKFSIARSTDTDDQPASGTLYMVYRAPSWFIDYGYMYGWDPAVEFSAVTDPVTHVGVVHYTSSDFAGANYASTIRFSAKQIGIGV